ncbi:MAG: SRPBCC family protein [Nitrospirae bacterium]|nr:SRPBCC family protein [Nitrospirota bacterium]
MRALAKLIAWGLGLVLVVLIGSRLLLPPGYSISTEVLIRVPPDQVWAQVGDLTKWTSWVRELEGLTVVTGETPQRGAVARALVYTGFETMVIEVTVVEKIPQVRLRYRMTGGVLDGVTPTLELQTADGGRATRVRWTEAHAPGGMWGNLIAAALGPVVLTHHEESLNRLKFLLERTV